MSLRAAILIATVVVIGGCDGSEEPVQPEAPAARRETVFDPLTSTIDRAEGVQQTVDEQAAQQRRQIDQASR